LIGSYLVRNPPALPATIRVLPITRSCLDLLDFKSVRAAFTRQNPRLIIHCAALSRSPACQAEPDLAWKLNVEVTRLLAELAAEARFVFFSSDLVFDGKQGAYQESAAVNPLSVYAESKVAAEQLVLKNPRHTVIRTSLNGGVSPAGDRGFNEEVRNAWIAGKKLRLFTDEFRSPIPAVVTARATWELALSDKPGIYHLAGAERLSRWQIGQILAKRWPEITPQMEPTSLTEYQGAPRPPDTSLNCAKAQALLSFPLPGLAEWLHANSNEPF
jgi:dTDP-4-dehydrorhamnose reductase